MVTVNFNAYASYVTDSLYQWDINQKLIIQGLNVSTAPEIHFSNANMNGAIARPSTLSNGVVNTTIPNSILQEALTVKVHIGLYDDDTFKVIEYVEIPVRPKERPLDYKLEADDEEVYSFNKLKNDIDNVRYEASETAQKNLETMERSLSNSENFLNNRIDNIVADANDVTGNSELVDIRVGVNGKTYGSAGRAVREQFATLPSAFPAITEACNLDDYTSPANYVFGITSGIDNLPSAFVSNADIPRYLVVECFGERNDTLGNIQTWGRQFVYSIDGDKVYVRYFKYDYTISDYTFGMWVADNRTNNHRIISDTTDLNYIVEPDNYIIGITDAINAPFTGRGFLLTVDLYSYGWLVQRVYGLCDNPVHFFRIGNNPDTVKTNDSGNSNIRWSEWQKVTNLTDINETLSNSDYVIANMGDSITGNTQDNTSISAVIENITGAKTYNLGFGGCRMTNHYDPWNAFCMCNIADAIVTGDFSALETSATNPEVPAYFANTVSILKNLDFSTLDIMTISYGNNDYTAGRELDNPDNKFDKEYYGGALRYSIERILGAYPNLKLIIVAPAWCCWFDGNGQYTTDSDERSFNGSGNTLHDFVDMCVSIGKEYHIPVVNPYDNSSINKYNYSRWFISGDGIHPNSDGRKELAKLIAETIRTM